MEKIHPQVYRLPAATIRDFEAHSYLFLGDEPTLMDTAFRHLVEPHFVPALQELGLKLSEEAERRASLLYDAIAWMASVDGQSFSGYGLTGNASNGPYYNGHNLTRLYLNDVYNLGDLRGRSEVWLAFMFESDASIISGQGPFLDDVSIVVERQPRAPKAYLPVIERDLSPVLTTLEVKNATLGIVTEYRVSTGATIMALCGPIPSGQQVPCGNPFPPGTYTVRAITTECGQTTGERPFPAGRVIKTVSCVGG